MRAHATEDIDFNVNFIVLLITSFVEGTANQRTSDADLIRHADLLCDMLIARFGIS